MFLAAIFGGLTIGAVALAEDQAAPGDINLSPKRVVFDSGGRTATVYIFNRGNTPATYSISLIDRVMTSDGRIMAATDATKEPTRAALASTLKSSRDFIEFAPRRVTLQPNESQTVRIRAMRPASLAPGEYRTHLTVTSVPPEDAGITAEQAVAMGSGQLTIHIVPQFSLSIPLIVRQGPVDSRASIEGTHLGLPSEVATTGVPRPAAIVSAVLVRLGANSVYGNLEVRAGHDVIGVLRGIAIYPEVERRAVQIPLTKFPAHGANLSLVFLDDDAHPGTELARVTLASP